MMMKGHSDLCHNLTTYWDGNKCVTCEFKPGHEVTPNCGRDDDGFSYHEPPFKPCKQNTFNDGSSPFCKPCSLCSSDFYTTTNCTSESDTVCNPLRPEQTIPITETTRYWTDFLSTTSWSNKRITTQPPQETNFHSAALWALPLAFIVTAMLLTLSAFVINWKRKKAQRRQCCERESLYEIKGFSSSNKLIDLEDGLNSNLHSAPLKTVLENLDVLEELVILLDPEIPGLKNTKHLASLCSLPPTWVTYAYFMKDSKSPLKAVLEVVTSRYPDWTVGHLAKLLKQMERSDTVAILAKLRPSPHISG